MTEMKVLIRRSFNCNRLSKRVENVGPNTENSNCLRHLEYLKTKGVTGNVLESEVQSLRQLVDAFKKELTNMESVEDKHRQLLDLN